MCVAAIALSFSATTLLFAQGRIFTHTLSHSALDKIVSDGSYILSLPGVLLAVAIWGYNSNRTVLSDIFIIAFNGILYGVLLGVVTWVAISLRTQKRR